MGAAWPLAPLPMGDDLRPRSVRGHVQGPVLGNWIPAIKTNCQLRGGIQHIRQAPGPPAHVAADRNPPLACRGHEGIDSTLARRPHQFWNGKPPLWPRPRRAPPPSASATGP
jgi:hypothetical protein